MIQKYMTFFKKHCPVILLCVGALLFYSYLVTFRYEHFSYSDWDMAFYGQEMWNLLYGRTYSSLFGYHCFGGHAEFVNFLILPIFALVQHPLTFTYVQILLFVLSGFVLYVIVSEGLGKQNAFLISLSYFIFPPNVFAMTHDCNSEALAPLFFLMAFYCFRREKLAGYYISLIFLLLIKENMSLIVLMFGFWGLFSKDRDRIKWGLIPIIISVSYFLVVVKLIIPHFLGMERHSLWGRFRHFGNSSSEILTHLTQFEYLKKFFLSSVNVNYLTSLFGVFLVPALLSPGVLLLIAPIIFYHLLSAHLPEKTIYFYYAAAVTPAIFLAAVYTLKKFKWSRSRCTVVCFILLFGCLVQLYSERNRIAYKVGFFKSESFAQAKWRLLRQIPPDAPVIATFEFLPALSLREKLYSFHKVYRREYQEPNHMKLSDFNTGKIFVVPEDVKYALINFDDDWFQQDLRQNNEYVRYKISSFLRDWIKMDSIGTVILYKRRAIEN